MKLYIIILTLLSTSALGQFIGNDPIDETNLRPWTATNIRDYQGVYHFGISEVESNLFLIIVRNKVYGQIRSGHFSEDGRMWMWEYENINDIRIEGNKFFSERANGEFVRYRNGSGEVTGLKINSPWSANLDPGEYEIGTRTSTLEEYLSGDYIEASLILLTAEDLKTITKNELRVMRNEIFARYGLRFKSGGQMDVYFRQKSWYQGQHDNVDKFLTHLEKSNIRLIKEVEGL